MSPLGIEIMLHYFCRCCDWDRPSPASDELLIRLVDTGMLEHRNASHEQRYEITPRGSAYVEFLKKVPIPTRREVWTVELETA